MPRRLPMAKQDISHDRRRPERKRLPAWFKTTLPSGRTLEAFDETKLRVKENRLNTVCEEARCPNIHDCWSRGTATFMIAGQTCTRGCRFCAVDTTKTPPELDPEEPANLADAISRMGLSHAVITVVNRDDLEDGGASHYRDCIMEVHDRAPMVGLEHYARIWMVTSKRWNPCFRISR